jgi:hypothetical protein
MRLKTIVFHLGNTSEAKGKGKKIDRSWSVDKDLSDSEKSEEEKKRKVFFFLFTRTCQGF